MQECTIALRVLGSLPCIPAQPPELSCTMSQAARTIFASWIGPSERGPLLKPNHGFSPGSDASPTPHVELVLLLEKAMLKNSTQQSVH